MHPNLTVTNGKDSDVSAKLIVTLCYATVELFGVCGNVLVILTIGSGPRRFQSSYYRLVFHLAVCDIFLLLSGNILFTIGPWTEVNFWSSNLGIVACSKIFPLVGSVFITEISLSVVIALLRHKAITQPLQPKVTSKRLKCIIVLVYITPLFLYIPKFLSQQVAGEQCTNRWQGNMYYYIYDMILDLSNTAIPMMFLIVLYVKMCYSLARHREIQRRLFSLERINIRGNSPNHLPNDFHHFRVERNVKMIAVSVVIIIQYFTAVLPVRLLQKMGEHGERKAHLHLLWVLPLYFLLSCSFNPLIYGIGDKAIRAGYKIAICKIISCLKGLN